MEITAAVARRGQGGFSVETIGMGPLQAGEVRIRIAGAGLCHTDISVRENG